MKSRFIVPAALGSALLALGAAAPALAHHAFAAEFDGNAPVLIKGKVTKVEWINPHAWVHMKPDSVERPDPAHPGKFMPGAPEQVAHEWMVEGGTPNTLFRSGLSKASLKPGTEIVVRGYQAKDKGCDTACKANGRDVTFPDGCKVFMGSSGTGAPQDGAEPGQSNAGDPNSAKCKAHFKS